MKCLINDMHSYYFQNPNAYQIFQSDNSVLLTLFLKHRFCVVFSLFSYLFPSHLSLIYPLLFLPAITPTFGLCLLCCYYLESLYLLQLMSECLQRTTSIPNFFLLSIPWCNIFSTVCSKNSS